MSAVAEGWPSSEDRSASGLMSKPSDARRMLLLAALTTTCRTRADLVAENLALRHQVSVLRRSVARPRLTRWDRLLWVFLRRLWPRWRECLEIAKPATVVAWHRKGWRLVWTFRSRKKGGRPPISLEVRKLIRRMSRENRLWGSPRIQAELARLGFQVAKSTVEKYMVRRTGPPSAEWAEFIRLQADGIVACDFFKIPTATFHCLTGFVVMELGRRRILSIDVTSNPTAAWAASRLRMAVQAMPRTAEFLIRDRDSIYGLHFRETAKALGLQEMVTAYRTPKMNAHCERLIGTLRRDLLDHVIVMGESHARSLLAEYADYYNAERCHQALDGHPPKPGLRLVSGKGEVVGEPVLFGLHHTYRRAA